MPTHILIILSFFHIYFLCTSSLIVAVSPVGLKFANTLISTWKALTATQTLFQKTANLIGVASGVVEVQLTVPGGTPDGTYNGVLVLTY